MGSTGTSLSAALEYLQKTECACTDGAANAVVPERRTGLRILIAEDNASLAEALRFTLTEAGYAVDWAADGAAADSILKDDVFGLVILDVGLPKLDGFEVLRRFRRRNPGTPVLILSAREKPEEKVQGLDLGADDYLVKPFSLSELQARVRALLRRGHGAVAPVVAYGNLTFDTIARTAALNGSVLALSTHETSVLEVLLRRFGRIVSKEHLVEQLYSYDNEVSQNAIEVYVHRVRKKIAGAGVNVRTLYGRGYLLDYAEQ
jgi:two-component system OmpR family response regulator